MQNIKIVNIAKYFQLLRISWNSSFREELEEAF